MNYGKSSIGGADIGGGWGVGLQNGSAMREGMANACAPSLGQDRTPYAIAVDGNHEAMAQLHSLLTHLEQRLSPLVSADLGRPEPTNGTEPCAISQIVGQIEGNTRGLWMACSRINALLDRLTV